MSSPNPTSPAWNTSRANTAISARTPGGRPEPELHADEGPHAAVAPGVVHGLPRGLDDPDVLVRLVAWRRERAPHAPQQQRRDRERDRVDRKRGVAAEDGRDDAAERRADGEHGSPQRPVERVGRREVRGIDDVGQRRRGRRIEHGRAEREADEQHVGEPQVLRSDQQERGADPGAQQVADDHQPAPVEAVGEPSGPRRRDEDRDLLGEDQDADRRGLAGGLQDQAAEGDEQKPVPAE